jgi:hypothetical protein
MLATRVRVVAEDERSKNFTDAGHNHARAVDGTTRTASAADRSKRRMTISLLSL